MVPQSRPIPVLITRPSPQGDRFETALQARYGAAVVPVQTPLLASRFLTPMLPDGLPESVILTSETGARAAGRISQDLPRRAYCVGDQTAKVAREQGFATVSADGDAEALIALLLRHSDHAPFLHLRGLEARGDIVARLQAQGCTAAEAIVYHQEAQPLSAQAMAVLQQPGPVIVPLFSPRTAQVFCQAVASHSLRADLMLVAFSPAVAAELSDLPVKAMRIARHPSLAELFLESDSFIISA